MLHRLFAWVEQYADHKNAKRALALVAFTESSFFPVPPFVLIVAMLAHEKRPSWIKLAIIGTAASVLGGVAAYFMGMYFYDYVGAPLVNFYGIGDEVSKLGSLFREHVFTTIILASLSPLPYKVFTISAGLFHVNIASFVLASLIGRSIRFFAVAYFSNRYGVHAKKVILEKQKYFTVSFFFLFCALILYFVLRSQGIL